MTRHPHRLAALSAGLLVMLAAAPGAPADEVDIGCVAYARYDQLFKPGPLIPHVARSWFVPQGLTAWPRQNWLIVSFYYPHSDGASPAARRTPSSRSSTAAPATWSRTCG